jgi:hypothetical protein
MKSDLGEEGGEGGGRNGVTVESSFDQMKKRKEVEYALPAGRRRGATAVVEALHLRIAHPWDSFLT